MSMLMVLSVLGLIGALVRDLAAMLHRTCPVSAIRYNDRMDECRSNRPAAPCSYASPVRRRWGSIILAGVGVLFGTVTILFGVVGVLGIVGDQVNPYKDRGVPANFILMVIIGFGVGTWALVRSVMTLRRRG